MLDYVGLKGHVEICFKKKVGVKTSRPHVLLVGSG